MASNLKEIKFITFPSLFSFFFIFGQHLPRTSNELSGRERRGHLDFFDYFQGRMMASPVSENAFVGTGNAITRP
jgi:hypothetical protein